MMAEFVKQILPVCAVFAGVTLAVALVQPGPGGGDARDRVVRLLTRSSISMICAICASALFLVDFGVVEAAWGHIVESRGSSERIRTKGVDLTLEDRWFQLVSLWAVAIGGTVNGTVAALRAIGASGFMRNESEGKHTQRLMVAGFAVIAVCSVLFILG
jgi:hypothetical protein